jgi:hypothetical protein
MTVEEAITYLRELIPPSAQHYKALKLAIEVLEERRKRDERELAKIDALVEAIEKFEERIYDDISSEI